MKGSAKSALQGFANIIRRLVLGPGSGACSSPERHGWRCKLYELSRAGLCRLARLRNNYPRRLPVLISLLDASQSDARELPALLRGKKVLVVGDDRQVSPSAAFLSIANTGAATTNFLSDLSFAQK